MSNDKVLTFKLITYENELRFGVTIPVIEAEVEREYEQGEAKALIRKFHDMMLGSTVSKVNDEVAICPNDIAAIFGLLKIPIKFTDANGNERVINGDISGILTWYRYSDDLSWQGSAAGILKNIPTNKKNSDDESLQSSVDESED